MTAERNQHDVLARELEYHEKLYSGFAQSHFARPAVRALRRHLARRILSATGAGPQTRMLSIGCGIGDTELLLAPHVRELLGVDLSPAAVRQARQDAERAGAGNARFMEGTLESAAGDGFDVVIAVFFLHHLSDAALAEFPSVLRRVLKPGGVFYSLDPSRYRLSGAVGRLLIPQLMRRYQTPDEHELVPAEAARAFRDAGFQATCSYYDFLSSPLAGLFPGWRAGYLASRFLDELLIRAPLLRRLGSNFEIVARA